MKFKHYFLIFSLVLIAYFTIYNDAKRDGSKLALQLCNCYNEESGRAEFEGVDPIKIPDIYIYSRPKEYPDFRDGFIVSLIINCPEYSNKLINWRGIGKNEFPVDKLFDPLDFVD
ncbi:MAG: hypothetical protein GQ574_21485 [Crocinitomix sp.]|nr:hypothetical protein [Crocinitomix sp.]